jgi:hypothetical protein
MELYSGGDGGGVRLLRYGPSGQFHPAQLPEAAAARKNDSKAFPFRFRRRSKSAPRNKPARHQASDKSSPANSLITYSANGEKIRNNKESPSKPEKVELVGFTSYHTEDRLSGGDREREDENESSAYSSLCESLKSHESRTSSNIKMERERLRRERLNSLGGGGLRPWASTTAATTTTAAAPLAEQQKISAASRLLSAAAAEREKFFEEARERFFAQSVAAVGNSSSSSDLFTQFLREREERLARLTRAGTSSCHAGPAAFLLLPPPPSSTTRHPGILRCSADSPLVCRRLPVTVGPSTAVGSGQLTGTAAVANNSSLSGGRPEPSAAGWTESNSDFGESDNEAATGGGTSDEKKTITPVFRAKSVDNDGTLWGRSESASSSSSGRERVIPIQILAEPLLPPRPQPHEQPPADTTVTMAAANIERRRPPLLQSLLEDVRAAGGGDPTAAAAKAGSSSLFHQPMGSFATALGFGARFIGNGLGSEESNDVAGGLDDHFVQLRPSTGGSSTAGLRDSFPGFPSFGNFPSFAVPLLPSDRLNLSPRTRSRQLRQKVHLAKAKSATDSSTADSYRYDDNYGEKLKQHVCMYCTYTFL